MGYDDSPYLCSRSSTVSSPGFGTSFHATDTVFPSYKVGAQRPFHHTRPASEIKHRSPGVTLRRKQSACSLGVLGDQICYKTFQDPARKTYSGDLLEKHSQRFTQDKPFTPKTLKSDGNSYLSSYRYYRAPRRKPTLDCTTSKDTGHESDHERYSKLLYEHVSLIKEIAAYILLNQIFILISCFFQAAQKAINTHRRPMSHLR